FSNLVNTESYTIKVYATVGRKVHIIGEYTFQPASAQTVHITTPEQFLAMSSNRSGNYVLDNDIDFTGIEFVSPFTSAFSGTFDGQGHSIKNVTFTKVATYTGIFGYVSSAKIQNLVIENVTIGTPSAPLVMTTSTRTGILAGYISTSTAVVENVTIKNSSINYSTSSTVQAYVGGAVGEFRAKMTGIELDNVSVHLKSTSYGRIRLGGVIGTLSEEATLKEVSSNANVSLDFVGNNIRNREIRINVGGVIGYHNARNINRSVENIYSTGNVTVDLNFGTASNTTSGNYSVYVGGLAGIAYSNIHHAFYAGSIEVNHEKNDYESQVSKSFHIGGLMGFYGSNK
ncbi:MAG: ZmpA/ZmpB/ZmpC family metallo-endopeptidase-related protein, partial [Acholeplasmataceae bacterium]|nr:ZmpA/ZmpB/ZmpC family metallo-endopeptidase-related protein [Acholeplasmataceae bacterium]